jgi:hypothetical protein
MEEAMLSRRSIFSLFAAGAAIAAGAKVQAAPAAVTPEMVPWIPASSNYIAGITDPCHEHARSMYELPTHTHAHTVVDNSGRAVPLNGMSMTSPRQAHGQMFPRGMLVTGSGMPDMISDGNGALFMVDSPQGREVLESMAAPNAGKSRW